MATAVPRTRCVCIAPAARVGSDERSTRVRLTGQRDTPGSDRPTVVTHPARRSDAQVSPGGPPTAPVPAPVGTERTSPPMHVGRTAVPSTHSQATLRLHVHPVILCTPKAFAGQRRKGAFGFGGGFWPRLAGVNRGAFTGPCRSWRPPAARCHGPRRPCRLQSPPVKSAAPTDPRRLGGAAYPPGVFAMIRIAVALLALAAVAAADDPKPPAPPTAPAVVKGRLPIHYKALGLSDAQKTSIEAITGAAATKIHDLEAAARRLEGRGKERLLGRSDRRSEGRLGEAGRR